jgi:hypothetical protein
MAKEFQKGEGKGSMFVPYGAECNPSNPNMGNMNNLSTTPHDMLHKNNKTVGTEGAKDLRGGAYKGKTQEGGIHSIPEHFTTQNGTTPNTANKRAKVTGKGE